MATVLQTADFSGSNGSHFFIKLSYDLLSQTKEPKQSVVRYYINVGSKDEYSASGTSSPCYINGEYVGSFTSIPAYSDTQIGYLDVTYDHDTTGECDANFSASASTPWNGVGDASITGSFSLPSIRELIVVNVKRSKGYFKSNEWKPKKTYIKDNGVWKLSRPFYKKEGEWA